MANPVELQSGGSGVSATNPFPVWRYGSTGSSYRNIAGAGTTVVKSGAGTLHAIVINKVVSSGVITIHDNTAASGTKIGTVTNPAVLLANQITLPYGCAFGTGLTIVTSAADDITVVYD